MFLAFGFWNTLVQASLSLCYKWYDNLIPILQQMPQLRSMKITLLVEIDPNLLHDPEKSIKRRISSLLLVYSDKIGGIPLAFIVNGVTPTGVISCYSGGVSIKVLIECIVLRISVGDVLRAQEGMLLGVFSVRIDGDREHSGDFMVEEVKARGISSFTILGSRTCKRVIPPQH